MAQMRLPTRITWIAKQGGSIRHIHNGDHWYPEVALCGEDVWPPISKNKDDHLRLFGKCKRCTKIYGSALDKLITQAEDNGFEVLTRRGGEKA